MNYEKNNLTNENWWNKTYTQDKKDICIFKLIKTNAIYRETLRFLEREIKIDGLTVLELGCGASQWLPYFGLKRNCKLLGIDFSVEGCKLTSEILDSLGLKYDIYRSSVENFDCREHRNTIDLVVSFGLLEHFNDRSFIYVKAKEILKPEGYFFAQVPNLVSRNLDWINKYNKELMKWHVSLEKEDIETELRKFGYKNIKGRYVGGKRYFANTKNNLGRLKRKFHNGVGELISRFADINLRDKSAYFVVIGQR